MHYYKFVISAIFLVFISNATHGQENFYRDAKVLHFLDDFSDESFSLERWDRKFPWGPYVSGDHYYTPEGNHEYNNGILSLVAKKEDYRGLVYAWDSLGNFDPYEKDFEYTSGMYYLYESYREGYFECRFKAPNVQGTNSALWLYGNENNEIDVFEIEGSKIEKAKMTLHWKDRDNITNATQSGSNYFPLRNFDDGFHTMGVLWDSTDVTWYYGDTAIVENAFVEWSRSRHVPNQALHPILTLDIGTMDGSPQDTTLFPCSFDIDYVSAYLLKPLNRKPIILGQKDVEYTENQILKIKNEMLFVDDSLNFYPLGHKILVAEGNNYEVISNDSIKINAGFSNDLTINLKVTNGLDTSDSYQVIAKPSPSTNIKNFQFAKLSVYPNPTKNWLHFNFAPASIKIYSSDGRMLMQHKSPGYKINIASLEKGSYIIHFVTKNGAFSRSFVKH